MGFGIRPGRRCRWEQLWEQPLPGRSRLLALFLLVLTAAAWLGGAARAQLKPRVRSCLAILRGAVFVDTCDVVEHSDKAAWVSRLPNGPPMREDLARLVEEDHDEAETEYYEAAADPTFVTIERDQRRFRAMLRRRIRHREANRRSRYQ